MTAFVWKEGLRGEIVVAGAGLEAMCWGPSPAEAPTIVLLHEGLGCVELWRDFPAKLSRATGFGAFVYSRRGYGRSSPATLPLPVDYMQREAVEILPRVLDAFGFRRGLLYGHSDGASIAAYYAGSVEDFRVRGLILEAPHFFTEDLGLAAIVAARDEFAEGGLKEKMARYHRDAEATFRGWNDAWLNPEFKRWNITDAIDHWRVPALLVQGAQDQYGTPAQIREAESRAY